VRWKPNEPSSSPRWIAAVSRSSGVLAAPVLVCQERCDLAHLRAIVANSKVSNVANGAAGIENARRMAQAAATEIGSTSDRVLVSSTGVIGISLPIDIIERGIRGMSADLGSDP